MVHTHTLMTLSPIIKAEVESSLHSTPPLFIVATSYRRRMKSRMADPSSSSPMRAKPEPTDSLSPSTSVELHKRSKTGCKTCRRRKKKCDEARPGCQNCAKNNILCGGYETRKPWRKGARSKGSALSIPELPNIINAIDNPLDSQLLSYFITHAAQALNIYSETHNPFDGFVIDMAIANTGLMHSLLCLSASCLLAHQPTLDQEIIVRHSHHFDQAVSTLRKGVETYSSNNSTQNGDCIMLQTILLAQEAIITGETHGSYRCHLLAAQRLVDTCGDLSADVQSFARQFLLYHNLANMLSVIRPVNVVALTPEVVNPETGERGTFSEACVDGILHGLLEPMMRTQQVRDGIRFHRHSGNSRWFKDERLLSLALTVETQLRMWQSRLQPNTPQYWSSLVYRQSAYVYLYRTIKPSRASPELAQVVSEGLSYTAHALRDVTRNEGSKSWICGVLLPPLFLLGCAAFDPSQRRLVLENFEDMQACNQRASIVHAKAILREVWSRMDAEHGADDAWDWEAVMKDINIDIMLS
ncbi:hypothetical protein AUEXF2481DRAFT_179909 [Aureobasidium subglaciale EXF-2481]|uniref:Zn(2)-C6 fungal-type domain-containing protein n=1 Tax=Aureobasidium subglaciale (strain EXF-2481) TaxID=1043005 RepID=A0A074YP65_AURSE|nr:uncharacterized protein AUEXF2481DRAFT_179909 [Aureobasidium subglaciale EXF-2481]KEQ99490.1 hypothetical protein AUEXF2481DRAFT_179909 [Aureobasidium subglaciale EXF-2481]